MERGRKRLALDSKDRPYRYRSENDDYVCVEEGCTFSAATAEGVRLHHNKVHLGIHGKRGKGKENQKDQAGKGSGRVCECDRPSWRALDPKVSLEAAWIERGARVVCKKCEVVSQ